MENPGKEPERITYNDTFDGFPSVSPDGTRLVFARSLGKRFMADNYVHVMDITPLGVGPRPKASPRASR
jgi:Tol biopolymer transport system component